MSEQDDKPFARARRGDLVAVSIDYDALLLNGACVAGVVSAVDRQGMVKAFLPFGCTIDVDPATIGRTRYIGDKEKCDLRAAFAAAKGKKWWREPGLFKNLDALRRFLRPFMKKAVNE